MIEEIFAKQTLIPVLTLNSVDDAYFIASIFKDLGFHALEVTLRTDNALDIIKKLKEEFSSLHIGAGTVTTVELLEAAYSAGAGFAVSPGFNPAMVTMANIYQFPYLPGIATISEAMQAHDMGVNYLKCFPVAALGGVPYLKALHNVLPNIRFCPTGGVSYENCRDYLSLTNVFAVGLSALAPEALTAKRDDEGLRRLINDYLNVTLKTSEPA